ncbi:SIMPL domain-containing protein [Allostreptomyces psammosilenae]|uniref:SIMPL domain-containing protein n=1 Tax=Allostreptomyces psammosilenae TaxID=1892865 RepID=A0A853A2P9_9ACTN|nr:SIMPL domain-containing protein [Allostreptomyces psammosilenae]NYI07154.1 hypothetical protein [Allostreptomyces psammosilenae]
MPIGPFEPATPPLHPHPPRVPFEPGYPGELPDDPVARATHHAHATHPGPSPFLPPPQPPAPAPTPEIRVRGVAVVEVDPELARLVVAVHARDRRRTEALDQLGERLRRCRSVLDDYPDAVEAAESGPVSAHPVLADRPTERVKGHQATATLRITVTDFTDLGALTSRLADIDGVRLTGPFWALRPTSPVHRDCRRQAVQAARQRAADYAEALGTRLAGLVMVADEGLSEVAPVARSRAMPAMARGAAGAPAEPAGPAPMDLTPVRQTVTARVEAVFTAHPLPEEAPEG